ncbi:hypothetical protein INT46_010331 [Mucor plumbeus]|uniref:Uncharacterized protein n=1 Tax=Mucor plumbeus TaxID=97098 RepID=A0A8H7V1T6_9FUNG|nr:hypothetical protein INT46_010331 [Mucor plumbeus]
MSSDRNRAVSVFPTFTTYFIYTSSNTIAPHLTSVVKNSIKSLLFNKASFSAIQKLYPTISLSTITRYRKQYLGDVRISKGGRPNKISKSTKSYIARQLRTDRLDGSKGMQEHLRMEGVDISLSGIRKGLKKGALMPKGKSRQTLSAKTTRQNDMHGPKNTEIIH